ncbi:MAG: hypothetical protein WCE79_02215 [Xanthobacteraceae bacterium]
MVEGSAEPAGESDKLAQGVTRFAQYTAPVMLAMLVSTAKEKAFAATFT